MCGGAHDRWLHQGDTERRQRQHNCHKNAQRDALPDRYHPGSAERAQQEVGARQNQVGEGQRLAEAHPVGQCPAKDRQKPD